MIAATGTGEAATLLDSELRRHAGSQFDPRVVAEFVEPLDEPA